MSGKVFYVESAVDIDGVATLVRYTDRVDHAAGFVLLHDGSYCEASVASEVFLAVPGARPAPNGTVLFECDGERCGCRKAICYNRPGRMLAASCRTTRSVSSAKNFYQGDDGDWWEKV